MPANFSFYVKLYLLTVPVFFIIDLLWLGVIARTFYQNNLSAFLTAPTKWGVAFVFYFTYIVGILFFAVVPALHDGGASWQKAAFLGAMFGFFTYMTYDLTNLATLNNWPPIVVLVDIIWGTVLCASVATLSYFIGKWL